MSSSGNVGSQSGCESRKHRLRQLIDTCEELKSSVEIYDKQVTLTKVNEVIRQSNDIVNEANSVDGGPTATELLIDAQVLHMTHEIMDKVMESSFTGFDDTVYVNQINKYVEAEGHDAFWQRIGDAVLLHCKTARFQTTMLGAFERVTPVVERANSQREKMSKKSINEAEVRPGAIESLRNDEEEEKDAKRLKLLFRQIRKIYEENGRKPIPYYKLIINPKKFVDTVSNAFQLSVLVKSGSIAFLKGYDGYLAIRPATKNEIGDETSQNYQLLCTINKRKCEEMIRHYNITEPMLSLPEHFD